MNFNQYLSNTFPELTDAELRRLGPYTVAYYDDAIGGKPVATKGSVAFVLELAGEPDSVEARDAIYALMARTGKATLRDASDRDITIYDLWYR